MVKQTLTNVNPVTKIDILIKPGLVVIVKLKTTKIGLCAKAVNRLPTHY